MNEMALNVDSSSQQSLQSDNMPFIKPMKLRWIVPTPEQLAEPPSPPFSFLIEYLQSSSDPNKVSLDLVKPLLDESILDLDQKDPMSAQLYPWTLFGEMYNIVEQLQYDHPWIERLVELMEALRNQPIPPKAVCMAHNGIYADVEFTWHKFPTFLFQQQEDFEYKTRYGRKSNSTWSRQEWLSINQFLALLVAKKVAEPWTTEQLATAGFWVLEWALEIGRALEDNIPSCAVWILTAGSWYRKNQGKELRCGKFNIDLMPGELDSYTGPADLLSNERWVLWKTKLAEFAKKVDLSEETRAWASRAADSMASLD